MKATLTAVFTCLALLAPVPSAQASGSADTFGADDRRQVTVRLAGASGDVQAGTKATLAGVLEGLRQGKKNWGAHVVVTLAQRSSGGWTHIQKQTVYTGGRGIDPFSFSVEVERSGTFRAVLKATPRRARSVSEPVRVNVEDMAIDASRTHVVVGRPITVVADCDAVCAGKRITLQKKVDGQWKYFARTHLNDRGRHNFTWNTVTVGTYRMRVVVGSRWAISKTVRFDVVRSGSH